MLDFKETPEPKDWREAWQRLVDLVRSMPDRTYRDGVRLTASLTGERVAHGGRSAPTRVYQQITAEASAAPVLQVGVADERFVTIISSADTIANLTFEFERR